MKNFFLAVALCLFVVPRINAGDVTAVQVNGTWKYRENEFKIWALGEQKLQIEFSGVYEYKAANGERRPTQAKGAGPQRLKATPRPSNPKARKTNARSRSNSRAEN
jgi:hypothetical protein